MGPQSAREANVPVYYLVGAASGSAVAFFLTSVVVSPVKIWKSKPASLLLVGGGVLLGLSTAMLGVFAVQKNQNNKPSDPSRSGTISLLLSASTLGYLVVRDILSTNYVSKGLNDKKEDESDKEHDTSRSYDHAPALPTPTPQKEYLRVSDEDTTAAPTPLISNKATARMPREEEDTARRYMEVLVHNVSHSDMILSVQANNNIGKKETSNEGDPDPYCLCRPRFSAFDAYSQRVLELLDHSTQSMIRFPCHARMEDTPRYDIDPNPLDPPVPVPIGFDLTTGSTKEEAHLVSPTDWLDLRVRGIDATKIDVTQSSRLNAVFFPLLATLLPQWKRGIQEKYMGANHHAATTTTTVHKLVVLVSGVGTPRQSTHSMDGNSTQKCAQLCRSFVLQQGDNNMTVVLIHSDRNIFRYDENIAFVQEELMPVLDAYRNAHARNLPYPHEDVPLEWSSSKTGHDFDPDWRQSFSLTLSFADGSPARNHAIQAALRSYRPTYFHLWQLKTFWHSSRIVLEDLEIHSFNEMNTQPAIASDHIQDPLIQQVVGEIKSFSKEFQAVLKNESGNISHDLHKFWLRKTHKPVIAVLAVQLPSWPKPKLYRGTNMEVSMPTGSLCAERNVIGTALSDNPTLCRADLKAIAVLAVPVPSEPMNPPSSSTTINGMRRNNWSHGSLTALEVMMDVASSTGDGSTASSRRESFGGDEDYLLGQSAMSAGLAQTPPRTIGSNALNAKKATPPPSPSLQPARRISLYEPTSKTKKSSIKATNETDVQGPSTSKRYLPKKKTLVVFGSSGGSDLNPLAPCGACHEWLKKISERNPDFAIVTFTDKDCNGLYCTPCSQD